MPASSPVSRAQYKKPRLQPPVNRLSLRTSSRRATPVPPSSRFSSQLPPFVLPSASHDVGISAEGDADVDEREEDDSMNEVIMAVDLRDRGTVGCAYYVAREEKLYMMEDVRLGGIEVIQTCKSFLKLHPYMLTCFE